MLLGDAALNFPDRLAQPPLYPPCGRGGQCTKIRQNFRAALDELAFHKFCGLGVFIVEESKNGVALR